MGFPVNYELSKKKGTLNKAALNERQPKGASGGTTTKTQRMGVSFDVVTDDDWRDVQRWFPGSDHVAKMLSQYDAPGLSWTVARKVGSINLTMYDVTGKEQIESKGADAGEPTIHIAAGGKHARVSFLAEGEIAPERSRTVRDYYKADVLWSFSNAQQNLPLNDGGASPEDGPDPKTPKRTGGRGKGHKQKKDGDA